MRDPFKKAKQTATSEQEKLIEQKYNVSIPAKLADKANRIAFSKDHKVVLKIIDSDSQARINRAKTEIDILKQEGLFVEEYCQELSVNKDGSKFHRFYIVMKRIHGKNLNEINQAHKENKEILSSAQIFINALKSRDALERFHKRGLAHRDVKPDNIMEDIDTNLHRLIDFENAILQEEARKVYVPGNLFFLAPEARPDAEEKVRVNDQKSDCYAYGVLLATLLLSISIIEFQCFNADKFKNNKQQHIAKLRELHNLAKIDAENIFKLIIKLTLADPGERGTLEDVKALEEIVKKNWLESYSKYKNLMNFSGKLPIIEPKPLNSSAAIDNTENTQSKIKRLLETGSPTIFREKNPDTIKPVKPIKPSISFGNKIINSFKLLFGCFFGRPSVSEKRASDSKQENQSQYLRRP